MKSFYFKLVKAFIVIFFISNVLMYFITVLFTDANFFGAIDQALSRQAQVIQNQLGSGSTTIGNASALLDTTQYSLTYFANENDITGSNQYKKDFIESMKDGRVIVQTSGIFGFKKDAGFRFNGGYVVIGLEYNKAINRHYLITQSGGFSLLIGSIIIIVMGKRLVRPVQDMSKAAKEIAKGNFTVHVESKGNDELGQLTKNFNLMAKELSSMEMMRSDFISSVSHEFKTPLATIEGYARLLEPENNEQKEYIDIILSETNRLSKMSRNILLLSQLENKEVILRKASYRLDEQLRQVVVLLENQWSKKSLELNMELPKISVEANESLMFSAFFNILDNAIKFADNGSAIDIGIIQCNTNAAIKIRNQGMIIPEDAVPRIFDKFYQADSSHHTSGNGLGLAIVKKIITLHNGEISVISKEGFGTEFCIFLPGSIA